HTAGQSAADEHGVDFQRAAMGWIGWNSGFRELIDPGRAAIARWHLPRILLHLLFHKLAHIHQEVRTVDVALHVGRDTLCQRRHAGVGIWAWIGNEARHFAVAGAADANAAPDAGVVAVAGLRQRELSGVRAPIARFGIGDVERVGAFIDIHPARPAELEPLSENPPARIEQLTTIVLTVAEDQPAACIERHGVNDVEFPGAHALLAPGLQ